MNLERIVTLANHKTKIPFLAMERSLRATGCQLPIWVIPYDSNIFDLPAGSTWWQLVEITSWLDGLRAHPMMRKYQCLTIKNYQFVDTDVCFLRNPEEIVADLTGFVTSCGHWKNPDQTVTHESRAVLKRQSTNWQKNVFNAGQFACDQILYTFDELLKTSTTALFIETCIRFKWNDQPGLNLLVHAAGVNVTNLTLPPVDMESTWAGDYPGNYESFWVDSSKKPYLIHWAGEQMRIPKPINDLFYQHLSSKERIEWNKQIGSLTDEKSTLTRVMRTWANRLKHVVKIVIARLSNENCNPDQ